MLIFVNQSSGWIFINNSIKEVENFREITMKNIVKCVLAKKVIKNILVYKNSCISEIKIGAACRYYERSACARKVLAALVSAFSWKYACIR